MVLLSTLIDLLYEITWVAIAEGGLRNKDRFSFHLSNIYS